MGSARQRPRGTRVRTRGRVRRRRSRRSRVAPARRPGVPLRSRDPREGGRPVPRCGAGSPGARRRGGLRAAALPVPRPAAPAAHDLRGRGGRRLPDGAEPRRRGESALRAGIAGTGRRTVGGAVVRVGPDDPGLPAGRSRRLSGGVLPAPLADRDASVVPRPGRAAPAGAAHPGRADALSRRFEPALGRPASAVGGPGAVPGLAQPGPFRAGGCRRGSRHGPRGGRTRLAGGSLPERRRGSLLGGVRRHAAPPGAHAALLLDPSANAHPGRRTGGGGASARNAGSADRAASGRRLPGSGRHPVSRDPDRRRGAGGPLLRDGRGGRSRGDSGSFAPAPGGLDRVTAPGHGARFGNAVGPAGDAGESGRGRAGLDDPGGRRDPSPGAEERPGDPGDDLRDVSPSAGRPGVPDAAVGGSAGPHPHGGAGARPLRLRRMRQQRSARSSRGGGRGRPGAERLARTLPGDRDRSGTGELDLGPPRRHGPRPRMESRFRCAARSARRPRSLAARGTEAAGPETRCRENPGAEAEEPHDRVLPRSGPDRRLPGLSGPGVPRAPGHPARVVPGWGRIPGEPPGASSAAAPHESPPESPPES